MIVIRSNDYDIIFLFERNLQAITDGLPKHILALLRRQKSKQNVVTIAEYIQAMKTEINPSASYRQAQIQVLCYLSSYHNSKILFSEMTRDDIISYLDSLRKPEYLDPLHKWIGTYNTRRVYLMRFFKWLHSSSSFSSSTTNDSVSTPLISQDKRPTPDVVKNIPKLKRKEKSIYKPSDLWTEEDDLLFLKYSGNKRDKAYHMLAKDSSCRPSEILNLLIKDLNFKRSPDGIKQYAEIMVNGKTGTRSIPLFNSLPYLKDWLDDHPCGQCLKPTSFLASIQDIENLGID